MKIYKNINRWNPQRNKKGFAMVAVDSNEELKQLFEPRASYQEDTCLMDGVYIDNLIDAVSFIFENNPDLMIKYLNTKGKYSLGE